jgi:dihydromethanopterin reductase
MVNIRVICAIGKHGQLGLNGRLPWEGNTDRAYKADVQRFFDLTRGHVVIAGPCTFASFPDWAHHDRTIVEIHASDKPVTIIKELVNRIVYVGGGPPVWAAYAHLISHWDVTRLPYDGEADRFFDPNWLCGSK